MKAKKVFKIIRHEYTVSEFYVEASNKAEALEIAQMDHIEFGKEEVLGADYTARKEKETPEGRIIQTENGYIDAEGVRHEA